MTAGDILRRAAVELNDAEHVRWPVDVLLDCLNDAVRQAILVRPEASARLLPLELVPGVRQRLPEGCLRLLDCRANLDEAGAPGRAVRPAARADFDRCRPDWRAPAAGGFSGVERFFPDEALPREFDVYPAVPEAVRARLLVLASVLPASCAAVTDPVGLSEEWTEPLLRWVVYRASLVDAPSRENRDRAEASRQAFWQAVLPGAAA